MSASACKQLGCDLVDHYVGAGAESTVAKISWNALFVVELVVRVTVHAARSLAVTSGRDLDADRAACFLLGRGRLLRLSALPGGRSSAAGVLRIGPLCGGLFRRFPAQRLLGRHCPSLAGRSGAGAIGVALGRLPPGRDAPPASCVALSSLGSSPSTAAPSRLSPMGSMATTRSSLTDAHQLHALRVAPGFTDAFDGRPNGLAAIGDDHHFVSA